VQFQGHSLNADWILSFEPLAATLRIAGLPDASATVPAWNRLEILDLMRNAYPADRALLDELMNQERHRRESEAANDSIVSADSPSDADDGCDCFGWPHIREVGETSCFDVPPEPIARPQPRYPRPAKEAEIQGWVFLHVLIGPDGLARRINVHRGITELNDAAVAAVRRWTWDPARLAGRPVCVWIEVPVEFRYRPGKIFHD
jgi:TonB family protein